MQDTIGAELEQLKKDIKRAVVRANTIEVVRKSGKRERDALRDSRKDADGKIQGKPTRLESATTKGIWGMDDWQRVADMEFDFLMVRFTQIVAENAVNEYKALRKAEKARTNGNVVVEQEPVKVNKPTGRKKKVNRKL